jgi:hypothetical protein
MTSPQKQLPPAENTVKFIPLTAQTLLQELLNDTRARRLLKEPDLQLFQKVAQLLQNLYHHEFHQHTKHFIELYSPLCHDTETYSLRPPSQKTLNQNQAELLSHLEKLLSQANYYSLDPTQELQHRLSEKHPLAQKIPLDEFEVFKVYIRSAPLRPSLIPVDPAQTPETYSRVCLLAQFKKDPHFDFKDHPYLYLKLFKNIPKEQLERIVPQGNYQIPLSLKRRTTLSFFCLLFSTTFFYFQTLFSPHLFFWLIPALFALYLLGCIRKQEILRQKHWSSFNTALYFSSMDHNFGVFYHLIQSAEEEEFKEALLVYYFLLTSQTYFTENTLNQHICTWLKKPL